MRDLIKVYQNSIIKQSYRQDVTKKKKWCLLTEQGVYSFDAYQAGTPDMWEMIQSAFPTDVAYTMINQIAYFKGKYYVTTKSKYIFVSSDLVAWETIELPELATDATYNKCIGASDDFMLIVWKNHLLYTSDGTNWILDDNILSNTSYTTTSGSGDYDNAVGTCTIQYSKLYSCFFINFRGQIARLIFSELGITAETDTKISGSGQYIWRMDFSKSDLILGMKPSNGHYLIYNQNGFQLKGPTHYTGSQKYLASYFNFSDIIDAATEYSYALTGIGQEFSRWAYRTYGAAQLDNYFFTYNIGNNDDIEYKRFIGDADWDDKDCLISIYGNTVCYVNTPRSIIENRHEYNKHLTGTITSAIGRFVWVRCLEID